MAYSVIKGTRANPQRTAVTGTPIRTEGAWPLYYGTASPYVRTSTSPITALSVDTETTDTANTVEGAGNYGPGYDADPTGQRTNVDYIAQDILDDRRGPVRLGMDALTAMQGPTGLLTALGRYGYERVKAYDLAKQIDLEPNPDMKMQALRNVKQGSPIHDMYDDTADNAAARAAATTGVGPGQEGDVGIGGPSPTGMTDTSGYAPSTNRSMDAGINQGPSQDLGDFDGAYGDFGFGGLGDPGGGNTGVGAGTDSMGGGYAGGYGMDAGIGRGSGIGGYDSDEGGMGTGSGGLGGLG